MNRENGINQGETEKWHKPVAKRRK